MASKKQPFGTCKFCERTDIRIVARGLCPKCYKDLIPPEERRPVVHKIKAPDANTALFPRKSIITVYECSDGREFGTELEALRHQLDITTAKYIKASKRV